MKNKRLSFRNNSFYMLLSLCLFAGRTEQIYAQDLDNAVRIFETTANTDIVIHDLAEVEYWCNYSVDSDSISISTGDYNLLSTPLSNIDLSASRIYRDIKFKLVETGLNIYTLEIQLAVEELLLDLDSDEVYSYVNTIRMYFETEAVAQEALAYLAKAKKLAAVSMELSTENTEVVASDYIENLFANNDDDKMYSSVTIKQQVWMDRNFDGTTFSNGDEIYHAKTIDEWKLAGKENRAAWCYYTFEEANAAKYGIHYNGYAIIDSRGLAPKGWRIPTEQDFDILSGEIAVKMTIGKKLKSTTEWEPHEELDDDWEVSGVIFGNGDNSSGFNAFPGGYISEYGNGMKQHENGYWWSETISKSGMSSGNELSVLYLKNVNDWAMIYTFNKACGVNLRLIKD